MRRFPILSCVSLVASLLCSAQAGAGAVTDLYRSGAFGLPWNAGKGAIQAKYPGGKWDAGRQGARPVLRHRAGRRC